MTFFRPAVLASVVFVGLTIVAGTQKKERAPDLGVPFEGTPGQWNAITDVAGVEVGLTTLISGSGPLKVGTGPVRTGVTAILPRGKASKDPRKVAFSRAPLFTATAEAVEEAIINALVAGETMTGANGRTMTAIPHDQLRAVLKKVHCRGAEVTVGGGQPEG